MPVEIFELVVRANVNESNNTSRVDERDNDTKEEKKMSAQEIRDEVLKLMNRKKER